MIIIQNGYECTDKIQLFFNLFFEKDSDITVHSNFNYDKKIINVYTTIFLDGEVFFNDFSIDFSEKDKKMYKKVADAAVMRSFVGCAMQIKKISLPWGVMCGIRPAKNVRELLGSGLTKKQTLFTLKKVYGVSNQKAELAMTVAENENQILSQNNKDSISIYIGIPFCPTRCLYCSFVSTDIRTSGKYMDEYLSLLIKEIEKTAEVIKQAGKYVDNIYIGGGTPTTLSENQLSVILNCLNKNIITDKLREFTIEAGRPDTITEEKLNVMYSGGVNRISINPQTMKDETLSRIGRTHTKKMISECLESARKIGFKNINMDLIAGLPGENAEDFRYSLDEVIKLDPENITIHCMCVKRSARLKFSKYSLCDSQIMNEMLDYAAKRMKETGRLPYYMYRQKNISGNLENVGYSKAGFMSFYNINIMEEVQTILAIGCGGSTKIVENGQISRIYNFKDPVEYINKFDEILNRKNKALELMR